ncbi:superoxide dismutase [Algivirga pacifica]|uniref:Superoxide dismutase n=1 Tax=Algivirga pacifica TaxID=1162670 RepID=A0ABP9D4U4_9BACT
MERRDFMQKAGWTGLALSLAPTILLARNKPFELPQLGYTYDAIEPFIDKQTMYIHHQKHHAGYVRKLNNALKGSALEGKLLVDILGQVTTVEENILQNAGGHYNHSLLWETLTPRGKELPGKTLKEAIEQSFVSYEDFLVTFRSAALGVFGSGWAWVCLGDDKKLFICHTPNQNNPLMRQVENTYGTPILGIDVWEHAYYLKYQNDRATYVDNFLKAINWEVVEQKYMEASK